MNTLTGKTLLAFKLAKDAINNNWVFIYLKDPTLLAKTLRLAKILDKNGNGVIIFTEDVDQVTRGKRDSALQDILNTLDGGDTKNMNVISLFTTNHIELIEPTFLRVKRIGSIISLGFLDEPTTVKFLHHSFPKEEYNLPKNLSKVAQYVAKNNIAPAFMAEIVESIKSKMIYQEDNIVKEEYLLGSVDSYIRQVNLSKKKTDSLSDSELLGQSLTKVIVNNDMSKLIDESLERKFQDRGW